MWLGRSRCGTDFWDVFSEEITGISFFSFKRKKRGQKSRRIQSTSLYSKGFASRILPKWLKEVWLFVWNTETPTIMVLVENGYRLYLRKVNSIGDTLTFHWTIIVYGMNGIPSPPTHPPPKSNFFPKRYRLRGFWRVIFWQRNMMRGSFCFLPRHHQLVFWSDLARWETLQFNH